MLLTDGSTCYPDIVTGNYNFIPAKEKNFYMNSIWLDGFRCLISQLNFAPLSDIFIFLCIFVCI